MKVFLVDDNPEAVKILGYALTQAGYEVAVAIQGAGVALRIASEQPDVVVLDVMMPGIDGLQVARQLRTNPSTANVPIILLTAKHQIQDKLDGFGAGADDYITKPVFPAELIVRINALTRRVQRYAQVAPSQGRVIGFVGVKGGVGTTTVAVNAAVGLAQQDKNIILVDLAPTAGAVAMQMGISVRTGLARVLDMEPAAITRRLLENSVEGHATGVKVLAMPRRLISRANEITGGQVTAMLVHLESIADALVLDLGCGLSPMTVETIRNCHIAVLLFEGDAVALTLAREMIDRLEREGIVVNLAMAMVNRARTASTYTRADIKAQLGNDLLALITPAPEIASHANKIGAPILLSRPDTTVATQLKQLAAKVL